MQFDQRRRELAAFERFVTTPLDELIGKGDGRAQALALFHQTAVTVPAYRAFLEEHGVDPAGVRSFEDFELVPPVTKQSYVLCHPLTDLCREGDLSSQAMIAVSSGST